MDLPPPLTSPHLTTHLTILSPCTTPRHTLTSSHTLPRHISHMMCYITQQVLDRNTVKLVAAEYDLLVVDKEEVAVTGVTMSDERVVMRDDEW